MTEIKTFNRRYIASLLRNERADLCSWKFDGNNYVVTILMHHNTEYAQTYYKKFPTYLAKKYSEKFPNFIEGYVAPIKKGRIVNE